MQMELTHFIRKHYCAILQRNLAFEKKGEWCFHGDESPISPVGRKTLSESKVI